MTTRIAILPYGASDSARALRDSIQTHIENSNFDATVRLLRSEGSVFRVRPTDVIINYGNRRMSAEFFGRATVVNPIEALNRAANKLQAFNTMAAAGVPTVEYTTQQQVAQGWVAEGSTVYARGVLNGHSGEGITVHNGDNANDTVGQAPLYTKGITAQRREWRVHIFKGVITYVQKKIRRNGYREDPNYREDVRNHHTGWVYSNQFNDRPTDAVLRAAYDAVTALGLDFGAVDIISRQDNAWVLEVNTAPGLTGTTLETYQHNVCELVKSIMSGEQPEYRVAYEVPAPLAAPVTAEEPDQAADENFALAAEPATEAATLATPTTQAEAAELNVAYDYRNAGTLERGFYLADMRSAYNQSIMARNVIVFYCGRNFYRHGWNLPLVSSDMANIRRISGVVLDNDANTVVRFD